MGCREGKKYLEWQTFILNRLLRHWKGRWKQRKHGNVFHIHDDVIKWKHFSRYRPFVRGIHRSPVNSPHKGQWCGALMFSLICAQINGWVNNGEAGDLKRHRTYYDAIVMSLSHFETSALRRPHYWCHFSKRHHEYWILVQEKSNPPVKIIEY